MSTRTTYKHRQSRLFGTASLVAAFAALTATAGLAIAKPIKPAPDGAAELQNPLIDRDDQAEQPREAQADAVKAQQTAYLGVSVNPLGNQTAQQLGLPNDTGLRLMRVAPGSPAEKAGLVTGDVLTHLGDQMLINPPQFSVLIRNQQPGDVMNVRLLRDGEVINLDAELGGRDNVQNNQPFLLPQRFNPGEVVPRLMPLDQLDQLGQLEGPADMNDLFEQMRERMNQQRNEMNQMMDQMRRQMRIDLDALGEMQRIEIQPGQNGMRSNIMVNDGEHAIRLQTNGEERQLTVKTADGEVLFDGVMPEDGQIEGLPEAVQRKIDGLLKNNRIELRINPAPQHQAEPKGPVA